MRQNFFQKKYNIENFTDNVNDIFKNKNKRSLYCLYTRQHFEYIIKSSNYKKKIFFGETSGTLF